MKYIKLLFTLVLTLVLNACSSSIQTQNTTHDNDDPIIAIKRVACVGDSITQGVGVSKVVENSYPAQLSKILGKGWDVQNYGKSGATLVETGDHPYTDTVQYVESNNFNPHIVVIMLGTNDMKSKNISEKGRYISDYIRLIERYKNLPTRPIVYICYPPPSYGNHEGITNSKILNILIPMIEKISLHENIKIIDIYSTLTAKKHLFPDTLHPNNEGAKIIANTVYKYITKD